VASHESALKAHRQNLKRREHNRQLRTRLRSALREIRAAIDAGSSAEAAEQVKDAVRRTVSLVDKMAGKGLIHRNTAGRYKSRLSARVARKAAAA
jgi:small subunit ribosomal protein S20